MGRLVLRMICRSMGQRESDFDPNYIVKIRTQRSSEKKRRGVVVVIGSLHVPFQTYKLPNGKRLHQVCYYL